MTTRTCSQVARVIGVRPDELDASLRAHVESCAECTRELEALERIVTAAREIDVAPPDPTRAERQRARLLEAARRSASPRASRTPIVIAGLAVAVAIAMVALVGVDRLAPSATAPTPRSEALTREDPPASTTRTHGAVRASAGAHFTLLSDAPDEIVRLVQGAITVSVTPLAAGERFRVIIGDAEVEVRGTAFEVSAHEDHLESVDVLRGAVEVRLEGHAPVLVHAGERWARPIDAVTAEAEPAPVEETTARATRPHVPAPITIEEPAISAPSWTAASGFEAGWNALHAGNPAAAATAFEEVLDRAPSDPLAEDASFWRAVALSRAERTSQARRALELFVQAYPRSVRAPEASVMLGWLLLGSGENDEARAMFERGTNDPTERVRASAARGLAAIPTP